MPLKQLELIDLKQYVPVENKNQPYQVIDQDIKPLLTEKGRKNIFQAFSKSKIDFRFFVVANPKEFKAKQLSELVDSIQQSQTSVQPNEIMATFYTNITANGTKRYPLTGWTLAHRLGHCMQKCPPVISDFLFGDSDELGFYQAFDIVSDRLDSVEIKRVLYGHPATPVNKRCDSCNFLSPFLLTMRSARVGELLHREMETMCELLAQYIITGKVTLLTQREILDSSMLLDFPYFNSKHSWILGSRQFRDFLENNDITNELVRCEQALNVCCENLLALFLGKMISF